MCNCKTCKAARKEELAAMGKLKHYFTKEELTAWVKEWVKRPEKTTTVTIKD